MPGKKVTYINVICLAFHCYDLFHAGWPRLIRIIWVNRKWFHKVYVSTLTNTRSLHSDWPFAANLQ